MLKKLFIFVPFLFFSCTSSVDENEIKRANQFFESVFQDAVLDSPEFQASLGYKSNYCLLYTSPSPRDRSISRMPSSA